MPTGMQTGRRTGVSALRTGANRTGATAGGALGGFKKKWSDMNPKKRTVIIAGVVILILIAVIGNLVATSNKPVALYPGRIDSRDSEEIRQKLIQWGIACNVEAGGTNVAVHPKFKSMALLKLAQEGLPRRQVQTTHNLIAGGEGGMVPDTKEDKARKAQLALEGDMIVVIRQIKGVADAYVKIVPQSDDTWGPKNKASASIMLRLYPGTKLSPQQIKGIIHLVTSSIAGLDPGGVKVLDTNGNILNDKFGAAMGGGGGGKGGYADKYILQRREYEKDLKKKVQATLDKFLGPNKANVAVSVEMDFSQKEITRTKYGGPANTEGSIESGVQKEIETYNNTSGGGSDTGGGITELAGSTSDRNKYKRSKVVIRKKIDKIKMRSVNTAPKIKRITCSIMVDGVKDKEMIGRIKDFASKAVGIDLTRGDEITVVSFPMTHSEMLDRMSNQPVAGSFHTRRNAALPSWLPIVLAIPMILIFFIVALFYMKQKSVQREKQRLVLTSGPSATVSDISDLLADKEGKITTPPATRVNTTDQLENLAKEKPTKVAELLKSTWLADK